MTEVAKDRAYAVYTSVIDALDYKIKKIAEEHSNVKVEALFYVDKRAGFVIVVTYDEHKD